MIAGFPSITSSHLQDDKIEISLFVLHGESPSNAM